LLFLTPTSFLTAVASFGILKNEPLQGIGRCKNCFTPANKKAYRSKAQKYHPDHGGDAWAFEQVNEAYRQLKNPAGAASNSTKRSGGTKSEVKKAANKKPKRHRPPFSGMGPKPEPKKKAAQITPPELKRSVPDIDAGGRFSFDAAGGRSFSPRRGKKKNSILPTLIGSLFGGVCAIACAAWILSIINPVALEEFRDVPLVNHLLDDSVSTPRTVVPQSKQSSVIASKEVAANTAPKISDALKLPSLLPLKILEGGTIRMVKASSVAPRKGYSQIILAVVFSITNESDLPVRSYTGGYRLIKDGRTFEYLQGDFKEKIPGGIEPGETLSFTLKIRPTKEQRKIEAWSEGAEWEMWLTNAKTDKRSYSVAKIIQRLEQVGF